VSKSPGYKKPSYVTNLIIFALICVVGYFLYSVTLALYKSHKIDVYIEQFREENERIEKENKTLKDEYEYVTSEAYKDKILKQNKGLINPGEEVIVITSEDVLEEEAEDIFMAHTKNNLEGLSNVEKWKRFIFKENPFQ
jgi:cell division protein FtsB